MAMFENEGYCPNNSIHNFLTSEANMKMKKVLGDRSGYMVYDPLAQDCSRYTSSIIDVLGDEDLGIAIAYCLKYLIPECKYSEIGKKILIRDVFRGVMDQLIREKLPKEFFEQNDEFDVYIREEGDIVVIYIARKYVDRRYNLEE